MANVKSAERTIVQTTGNIASTRLRTWNRNYTLLGSETTPQIIEMFDLPGNCMIVAMTVFHENLGAVTFTVGTTGEPAGLIQSEDASSVAHGVYLQGIATGIVPSAASRTIEIALTKTSGSYVTGAKLQLWAIGVEV